MKKIYFSYAYSTPNNVSEAIKEKLIELGVKLEFYQKGTAYSDVPVRSCDAFVLFLPNNAFEAEIFRLTQGIQKELNLAYQLKKDIILAYLSKMAGGVTFYLTNIDSKEGKIKGISGTNSDVIKLFQGESEVQRGDADELDWLKDPFNIIL
jgi:hypothetical protein